MEKLQDKCNLGTRFGASKISDVEEITKKIRELKITKQDCLQEDKRQFALSDLQSAVGLARGAVQMLTSSMEFVRHN